MSDLVRTAADGPVLAITLDRPDVRNAFDRALSEQLLTALEHLDADPALGAGVITGAGGGFSGGMDLKSFLDHGIPEVFLELLARRGTKPLVAAIEGFAVAGGLEVALACDLLVAARDARIGIVEVTVGLFAAGGGLLRLPRLLPVAVASELALTGCTMTAGELEPHGMFARVTEPGEALDAALALARDIASNAPLATQATKQLLRAAVGARRPSPGPSSARR